MSIEIIVPIDVLDDYLVNGIDVTINDFSWSEYHKPMFDFNVDRGDEGLTFMSEDYVTIEEYHEMLDEKDAEIARLLDQLGSVSSRSSVFSWIFGK
jgi:hypothetical protein